MLYFNLTHRFKALNITHRVKHLMSFGFSDGCARHYIDYRVQRISLSRLEELCAAFNCTPNDLLNWKDTGSVNSKYTDGLRKLIPKNTGNFPVAELMKFSEDDREKLYDIIRNWDEIKKQG